MKKLLFMAMALIALQTSFAQTFSKGNTILEGTASYAASTSAGNPKTTDFSPSIGYFLSDKFAVGAQLGFGSEKTDTDKSSSTSYGVFARCYVLNVGDHLKAFTQLDLGGSNSSNTADVKTTQFGANVGLGLNYFLSKKLAITTSVGNLLGYTTTKVGDGDSVTATNIGFSGFDNPLMATKFGILYKF